MAFSEEELQTHKIALDAFLEKRRPPEEIRDQVDIAYSDSVDNQSIMILEIRPVFMQPGKKVEMAVAKATFERTSDTWKIYWQRSNMKWVSYEPVPAVGRLEEFLQLVDEDRMGCFWG